MMNKALCSVSLSLLAAMIIWAVPTIAQGTTITVGHGGGYDYGTITAALAAATSGDTITVADGTYNYNSGESFPLVMKQGVTLQRENESIQPIIAGISTQSVIEVENISDPENTIIDGFIIRDGGGKDVSGERYGGGIFMYLSWITIRNCKFTANNAKYGGGMFLDKSSPNIFYCEFEDNESSSRGGGIYCKNNSNANLYNCTFINNSASDSGGGMYCYDSSPTLTDCTFSNNSADYGGGMYCSYSSPTLSGCTFSDNSASDYGGGMYCKSSSSPTLTDCSFSDNSASYDGGGMYCKSSSPTLTGCSFSDNSASDSGGGMYCYYYSSPTLTGCTFSNNRASDSGGGMYCYSSFPILTYCTFTRNSASDEGGGVNCHYSSPTLKNCILFGNIVNNYGGGISCDNADPIIINSIINFNISNIQGGGIHCDNDSDPTIKNCVITRNKTSREGGALFTSNNSNPILKNTILWNNSPDEIYDFMSPPDVIYCDIKGGYSGTGNINADPLWVDYNYDFHLLPGSPCIDAGTNLGAPDTDFDGQLRPNPNTGITDIGADEFYSGYVTPTPRPTATPTVTPTPTITPTSTSTPTSTNTPTATSTTVPTFTPRPTYTSTPTSTPRPYPYNRILVAGYCDTYVDRMLTSDVFMLSLSGALDGYDIIGVELCYLYGNSAIPLGIALEYTPPFHTLSFIIKEYSIPSGSIPFGLVAHYLPPKDSELWPYLVVPPGPPTLTPTTTPTDVPTLTPTPSVTPTATPTETPFPPTACFTIDQDWHVPDDPFKCDASCSEGATELEYWWDWDDGTGYHQGSDYEEHAYTWDDLGYHDITLKVIDLYNQEDTYSIRIEVVE